MSVKNYVNLWYPPLLASVLYGIYVISTNFNSPENFSWIFLFQSIILFYGYLFIISRVDGLLEKKHAFEGKTKHFFNFIIGWVISLMFGVTVYIVIKQSFITIFHQNDSIGVYHILIIILNITVGFILIFSMYLVTKVSQQQINSELKKTEYEKDKLQLQYELLYNKLEPHFLFNNLNTLHSMIVEKNPLAEEYVMSLAKVMRYSFQSQENESVTIEKELEIFEHYMNILKERVGENLLYEEANLNDGHKLIIPMTLLNLLENVIKHNEIGPDNPIKISINVFRDHIKMINNTSPKQNIKNDSKSGLNTISKMYKIKTGNRVSYFQENGYFIVEIPYLN